MFTPPNLKSANIDPVYMDNFIKDELESGRLDCPFLVEEAHIIFAGHFRTAPLGFFEKPGSSALHLIRHHSKEDGLGHLTNGWLDPSDGAMKFYSAMSVEDFVSFLIHW